MRGNREMGDREMEDREMGDRDVELTLTGAQTDKMAEEIQQRLLETQHFS